MDRTDYQILNLLQRDSRITLRAIGDQVGLTAPAVSERIRRLEERGVIRGFPVNIDRTRLDSHLTGFILVSLIPETYRQFCAFCDSEPAIIAHYRLAGINNALLRFAVRDTRQLGDMLTIIKQYGDSQTSVSLETYFEQKDIPLPE